jgi:hypothetical protein
MTKHPASKVTPEVLATMVDLLPTIGSLRDLCAVTGLRLDTVRRTVAPFLAIMKLTGAHPQCGCGRDRFHPYGCADSYTKGKQNPVPGHKPEDHRRVLDRRAQAISMLVAGDRLMDIDNVMGMKKGGARSYARFLTPEQRAARERQLIAAGRPTRRLSKNTRGSRSDPRSASYGAFAPTAKNLAKGYARG